MTEHKHDWHVFVGIPVFGGDRVAWVRHEALENDGVNALTGEYIGPWKWACDTCGDQGYEVPA
jgi:hypothetical protein